MATGTAEFATRAVERLSLFSDAVAAIAITLLAIDLPVPSGPTVAAFWSSVRLNNSHYAAFLISFVVIAGAWSRHHDMFRYVVDIDTRLRQLNMAWLLTVVLIPFATRLLTSRGHQTLGVHALRLGFYALLQVVASALLLLMLRHLTGHQQAPETPDPEVTSLTRQSYGWLLGFGLSIPLFFAWSYAWVLWIVGPLAFSIWSRWRQPPAGEDKDDAG